MAICTTAITSPASDPIMANPTMRSWFGDQCFGESATFIDHSGPQQCSHPQFRNSHGQTTLCRLLFGETHMGDLRISEEARGVDSVLCRAISTGEVVSQ